MLEKMSLYQFYTLNFVYFIYFLVVVSNIPTLQSNHDHDVAVCCGSSGNVTATNGRLWIGDSGVSSLFVQLQGKSSKSRAIHRDALVSVPYKTARVSLRDFAYRFSVKPGQKFVRLHFYPGTYKGSDMFNDVFTVKAGQFTLLSNFSASLEAYALGTKFLVKEFCLNIEENQVLSIHFLPTPKWGTLAENYAFINGIEIVSMPTGLYFTPEGHVGAIVVGQKHSFFVDNTTALEMIKRLNIGGSTILSAEDSSMFRRWDDDSSYLAETGDPLVNRLLSNRYTYMPKYVALVQIYETSRSKSKKTLSWKIPVDLGFRYLIRLHFSELEPEIGRNEFVIIINNRTAEDNVDVVKWSGVQGIPVYRDYIVMMAGDRMEGKRNLVITFRTKFGLNIEQMGGVLNGLEIFKLSNPDNNLASTNHFHLLEGSKSLKRQHEKARVLGIKDVIATVFTVIITLLSIVVYQPVETMETDSGIEEKETISLTTKLHCRRFSLAEIILSTDNFSRRFLIGRGGFGEVYRGSIDNGAATVAIKRMKSGARQGEREFWTEINMLSELQHDNLVCLIGFCKEGLEMILVYDYMAQGTLSDHLRKYGGNGRRDPSLAWNQWLDISIGAARGLSYIHTSQHRVIHRDIKSSNILIDENWVAKVADFGFSLMLPESSSFSHISTNPIGTNGYVDPEYQLTHRLTRKSDVYSFGVVLFEILSGRPAIDIRLEHERLAVWAPHCIRDGNIDQIVDPFLVDQVSPACLKVFLGIAARCVRDRRHARPTMANVVMSLELAAMLQENAFSNLRISLSPHELENFFAMEVEFRYILALGTQTLGPEHLPSVSGVPSNEQFEGGDDDVVRGPEYIIELVHPNVMSNLKHIAKFMFRWNYGTECTETFVDVRRHALDETLINLQGQRLINHDILDMDWHTLNSQIRSWMRAVKIFVCGYLSSDKKLSDEIFGEFGSVSSTCFVESSSDSVLKLLRFIKSISTGQHGPEKLFKILGLYEVLANLSPHIDVLYAEAGSFVSVECQDVLNSLNDLAKEILLEYEKAVSSSVSSASTLPGILILPTTGNVMKYVKTLFAYSRTLGELLETPKNQDPDSSSHGKGIAYVENNGGISCVFPVVEHVKSIISVLLDELSKKFMDDIMGSLGLMINLSHMEEIARTSELITVLGDGWLSKHYSKLEDFPFAMEKAPIRSKFFSHFRGESDEDDDILFPRFKMNFFREMIGGQPSRTSGMNPMRRKVTSLNEVFPFGLLKDGLGLNSSVNYVTEEHKSGFFIKEKTTYTRGAGDLFDSSFSNFSLNPTRSHIDSSNDNYLFGLLGDSLGTASPSSVIGPQNEDGRFTPNSNVDSDVNFLQELLGVQASENSGMNQTKNKKVSHKRSTWKHIFKR